MMALRYKLGIRNEKAEGGNSMNSKVVAVLLLGLITITCTKSDKSVWSDGKTIGFDETVQSDGKIIGYAEIYGIDIINGIWENTKNAWLFLKGNYSWGENAYSTSSVVIDLNADSPYIGCQSFGPFYVQEKKAEGNRIVLTGYYIRDRMERKDERLNEIVITLIDGDTFTIELIGKDRAYWLNPLRPENPNDYYYRVPVDAPYEPLQMGEDLDGTRRY
jgi:hypothetical protein